MIIEILGSGCANCKKLEQNAAEAANAAGISAEVRKVQDMEKILEYGVMMTPGLVIDGKVKSVGKVLTKSEIINLLKEE